MDKKQAQEEEPIVVGEPLETEDGVEVPAQQNVGFGVEEGGGEWPDPRTPPRLPARGAAKDGAPRRRGSQSRVADERHG